MDKLWIVTEEAAELKLEYSVSDVCDVNIPDVEIELLLDRIDVDGGVAVIEDELDEDCEPEYEIGVLVDGYDELVLCVLEGCMLEGCEVVNGGFAVNKLVLDIDVLVELEVSALEVDKPVVDELVPGKLEVNGIMVGGLKVGALVLVKLEAIEFDEDELSADELVLLCVDDEETGELVPENVDVGDVVVCKLETVVL